MAESREWNNSEQLLSQVREYLDIDPEEGTEPGNYEGNGQFCSWFSRRSVGGVGPSYKDAEDNSMLPFGVSSLLVRIHYTQLSQESIHL